MTTSSGQWMVLTAALLAAGAACLAQGSRPATAPDSRPVATAPDGGEGGLEAERVRSTSGPAGGSGAERDLLRRDGEGLLDGWGRTVLALAVVLGAILVLRFVLKRLGGRPATARGGPVEVLARSGIGPRQQLLLVRLGGKLILVGSSPAGLSTLHVVGDAEEVAELTEAALGTAAASAARRQSDAPPAVHGPEQPQGEAKG